jgi:hypothetical protein
MQTKERAINSAKIKAQLFGLAEIWRDGEDYYACAHGYGYVDAEPFAAVASDGEVTVFTVEQIAKMQANRV